MKDVEELQAQLSKLKHQLQQTAQELEQLRKASSTTLKRDLERLYVAAWFMS